MARMMQAAVVEQFGKPLALRELDIPSPGAGQILVKTEACGVCHTDFHAAKATGRQNPPCRSFRPRRHRAGRCARTARHEP